MSGHVLVKLRSIVYNDRFELAITDRTTGECRVIPLDDDQLAVLHWEFADALMQRHAYQKRLSRQPVPERRVLSNGHPEQIQQHQAAAE
jgi:hypothetical protein